MVTERFPRMHVGDVQCIAKALTSHWLLACAPASLLFLMGYAFNSNKMNSLITVPLRTVAGLLSLWFPVLLRAIFRIKPV